MSKFMLHIIKVAIDALLKLMLLVLLLLLLLLQHVVSILVGPLDSARTENAELFA